MRVYSMSDEETYRIETNCYNCEEPISLDIKKGRSLSDHLQHVGEKCPKCKCHLIPNRYT